MIYGGLAIILNLLSITAFCMLLLVVIISIAIKLKAISFEGYSAVFRQRILWLVALAPWVIGFIASTLALFSGTEYLPLSDSFDLFHWHHPQEFLLYSWHGLSLCLAIGWLCLIVGRSAYQLFQSSRQTKLLHDLSEFNNSELYQLDAEKPAAFTAGYFKPKSYITSALQTQLNQQEYKIVQLHEQEHARRFDPLKKYVFQRLTAFFPNGVAAQLNQSMVLAMELSADSAVSRVIKDKSMIAKTLLKVRRLSAISSDKRFDQSLDDSGFDSSDLCHYAQDNIQQRILYLLSDEKQKAFPFFMMLVSAILMSVICALSVDVFHHLIETTLSH